MERTIDRSEQAPGKRFQNIIEHKPFQADWVGSCDQCSNRDLDVDADPCTRCHTRLQ